MKIFNLFPKFILVLLCVLSFGCLHKGDDVKIVDAYSLSKPSGKFYTDKVIDGVQYKQMLMGEIPGRDVLSKQQNLILSTSLPKTFNYWAGNDVVSLDVSGLMYEGLIDRDPFTGEIVPHLASDIQIKNDGKKIIVTLRQGLKWSDNKPITSDDVLFTYNTILKNGFETLGSREKMLVEGEFPNVYSTDKRTVVFEISKPFAPFVDQLSYPLAPAHYFRPFLDEATKSMSGKSSQEVLDHQRNTFLSLMGTKDNPDKFVVSGPFKISEFRSGERIEYTKNPNYFVIDRDDNRLPYFQKLTYVILSSTELELFKFINGEIPFYSLTGDKIPILRKVHVKNSYTVYSLGTSNTTVFFSFNLSPKGVDPSTPQYRWFHNKDFRNALAVSINRQELIDTIYLGAADPLCLYMSPNALYFHKDLHNQVCNMEPDIPQAKQLLTQAGFRYKDGLLYDTKDNPVRFSLYTNAGSINDTMSPRELMATSLKNQWVKLGIQVDLKIVDFSTLVGKVSNTREWDSIILGLGGGNLLEPHNGANVWKSKARLHLFNLRKPGEDIPPLPWEAEVDSLIAQGTLHTSMPQRQPKYHRMQEIIWDQKPMIYLVSPKVFLAASDKIQNFMPTRLSGYSHNLIQWYYSE